MAAWFVLAMFYFYQYVARSCPAVMLPQLSEGLGISALAVASLVGLFYYGYSPFSLVSGAAMDRLGAARVVPAAAAMVGIGALLFATGHPAAAGCGRFLQGAGGVFALIGAIDVATRAFPPGKAATLIGATQMCGMAGGSVGQFAVGPLIASGVTWRAFWIGMGVAGLLIGAVLMLILPKGKPAAPAGGSKPGLAAAFGLVFRNPQSILCGLIAGLLFIPTTIFDMVWGVRYLQEGHGLEYAEAVLRSAAVPFGWIVGCPLLGFISDRLGRRKPVILGGALMVFACTAWALYGRADALPPYVVGLAMGVASGAAMIPYTVVKEANPPSLGGTATGVINFVNFTLSALLGPLFAAALRRASGGAATMALEHYRAAFTPLLYGIAGAIVLTLLLKETGRAGRALPATAAAVRSPT
ncbi:MAG TPA: MFS transporter [Verrucomicrobiae bacterium]|nr:MFS transporter [Verrucomicrobiae bacterium]